MSRRLDSLRLRWATSRIGNSDSLSCEDEPQTRQSAVQKAANVPQAVQPAAAMGNQHRSIMAIVEW